MSISVGRQDNKSDIFIIHIYGGSKNESEPTMRISRYDKETDRRVDIGNCHLYEPTKLMNLIIKNSEQAKYDPPSNEERERRLAVTDRLSKLVSKRHQ